MIVVLLELDMVMVEMVIVVCVSWVKGMVDNRRSIARRSTRRARGRLCILSLMNFIIVVMMMMRW